MAGGNSDEVSEELRAELGRLRAIPKYASLSQNTLLRVARNNIKSRQAKADNRKTLGLEAKKRRSLENHVRILVGGAAIAVGRDHPEIRALVAAQIKRGPVRDEDRALLALYLGAEHFPPPPSLVVHNPPAALADIAISGEADRQREAEPA